MPPAQRDQKKNSSDPRGKRRDIIDGAARVFHREGFSGASVAVIAAEAAVSKRTLYQYFRSKEELFEEIVREICGRILAPLAPSSVERINPRETLRELAQSIARITVLGEGLELFRMVSAEAKRFPELGRIFWEQGHAVGAEHLAACFGQWHAAGAVDIPHPKAAADLFFGMVNSVRLRALLGVGPAIDRKELDGWIDMVIDVFLHGVERCTPASPQGETQRGKRRQAAA